MYAEARYGKLGADITWSVVRSDAALTIEPATSARVSCSLRKPSTRDQSATYGDGAYCACSATSRVDGRDEREPLPLEQQLPREQRAVQLAQVTG